LPLPVIGELLYGAKKSRLKESNLARFRDFIRACDCLDPSTQAAETYADFKLSLKNAGTPIPENDIWIAAIAQVAGLTLVTDDKHFRHLQDFRTVNWL
jgi:tRNA(fMet)-specific endonuclease VapC